MEKYYRYDAHCHIFTLKYALKEVKSLWHDIKQGTYPWVEPTEKPSEKMVTVQAERGKLSDIIGLLRQLYELIHAAGGSEEENLDFLQKEAKKAFPGSTLRIVPLMMDIFYMLAYPLNEGQEMLPAEKLMAAGPFDEEEFQASWNEILDGFSSALKDKKSGDKTGATTGLIDMALQLIEEERQEEGVLMSKENATGGYSENLDFYHTEGFCYHMDNLMDLVKTRNGELYPFVAIDPRRPDMIKTLLSGAFFQGDPKFYGVKLYPRMGFHPLCKPMAAVYKYCSDNNLPITFHCGKGGFPPSTTWKYFDFGNPANFEPVVQQYPNLRIDFAHLGSSDPTYEWADKIVEMVNKYDNVYSDLSCYTEKDTLVYVKETYWDKNPKLKTRMMFGTDFDVMYFTGRITMQLYYKNFKGVFSADELKVLMHDNPIRFMDMP